MDLELEISAGRGVSSSCVLMKKLVNLLPVWEGLCGFSHTSVREAIAKARMEEREEK
jgi:hypothetical protein